MYKSGFATTQAAYEAAVKPLFDSLDRLEKILEGKDYLVGNQLTEADVRLYTTIVSASKILALGICLSPAGLYRSDSIPCIMAISNATSAPYAAVIPTSIGMHCDYG